MTDYSELVKALLSASTVSTVWEKLMLDVAAAIEALQAQLPKRGKWKKISQHKDSTSDYECSACLGIIEDVPDDDEHPLVAYCPMCGAKMEAQDESAGSL